MAPTVFDELLSLVGLEIENVRRTLTTSIVSGLTSRHHIKTSMVLDNDDFYANRRPRTFQHCILIVIYTQSMTSEKQIEL